MVLVTIGEDRHVHLPALELLTYGWLGALRALRPQASPPAATTAFND
jgi:hypothetical protein